jgi:hypothetical protein
MDIKVTTFDGLGAIEFSTPDVRLVAITELGPRIASFGRPGGENLLYWQNDDLGREGWRLLGGHRPWVTRPGADESEDAYAADNEPCTVDQRADGVRITGGVHPFLKTARGLEIEVVNDRTLRVTTFLTNCGPMLYSGGVWSPTCTDPSGGKQYGIPLGDRSQTWDMVKIVIPRTFAGHSSRVNDPQIQFNEEFMIISPEGVETKRMVMAPLGMIAMSWPAEHLSFVKHSAYQPLAQYPFGCNLAIYVGPDNFMVEMETYGAEQTVQPGQTIQNTETWALVERVFKWQDPSELTKLF